MAEWQALNYGQISYQPVVLEQAGEGGAGELRTLIGVEDGRTAVARDRFLHGIDTKRTVERDRHARWLSRYG